MSVLIKRAKNLEFGMKFSDDLLEKLKKEFMEPWAYQKVKGFKYFTPKTLCGDFIREIIGMGNKHPFYKDLKCAVSKSMAPILSDMKKDGLIEKHNKKTYIVKE